MMMLKLQQMKGVTKDNQPRTIPVYVRADHITAIYKDSDLHNTTVALSNGGYLSVLEDPETIMIMGQMEERLTPKEWKERKNANAT